MRAKVLLPLLLLALMALPAAGEIKVIDADLVNQSSLAPFSVPTVAQMAVSIYLLKENVTLEETLSAVAIPTAPSALKEVFLVNHQASLAEELEPVEVPTDPRPLERLFLQSPESYLAEKLSYPGGLAGDDLPPLIRCLHVMNVTDAEALVTWDTDELASGVVELGLESGNYSMVQADPLLALNHSICLQGLASQTTYYLRARSIDRSGNEGDGGEVEFSTLP